MQLKKGKGREKEDRFVHISKSDGKLKGLGLSIYFVLGNGISILFNGKGKGLGIFFQIIAFRHEFLYPQMISVEYKTAGVGVRKAFKAYQKSCLLEVGGLELLYFIDYPLESRLIIFLAFFKMCDVSVRS